MERLVRSHFHRLFPFISKIVFVLPSVHPVTVVQHHSFSSSNVSVQVRRLVRRNLQRLVRSHFHRLFPFISQIVFVLPSVHPVTVVQHRSFSSSNVRGQGTAHLVRCTLDPLVGPNFLHFMAVFRAVGAENRKIGLKIAFSGS